MATVSFKPYKSNTTGVFFYGHAGSANVNLLTYGSKLSSVTTVVSYGQAQYIPGDEFPAFTNMVPNSAYSIFQGEGVVDITTDYSNVFPTTWRVKPGFNMITIDRNAVNLAISATPITYLNTIVVLGTVDGTDPTDIAVADGLKFLNAGFYSPPLPGDSISPNQITVFRPGSSYLISVKSGATPFDITYQRRSQYIITNANNTAPTGPGFIITCENGDRLTTGVVG
jgi:hypothetical protein